MKITSLDLRQKADPHLVHTLELVAAEAELRKVPFFVVGATARDLVLELGYGFKPLTATRDLDFGIAVDSMESFREFKTALIENRGMRATSSEYCLRSQDGMQIDLLPFGEIESGAAKVVFPPPQNTTMNMLGFKEAYRCAIRAKLKERLEIRVASIAGLLLLKLVSWNDRPTERPNDAEDIGVIVRGYFDAGNADRVFEEHVDLISGDFDTQIAGARLLGRDLAAIVSTATAAKIFEILGRETRQDGSMRLASAMTVKHALDDNDRRVLQNLLLLTALLEETRKSYSAPRNG